MHLLAGSAVRAALIRLCLLHLLAGPAVRAALIRLCLLHLLAGPAVRVGLHGRQANLNGRCVTFMC